MKYKEYLKSEWWLDLRKDILESFTECERCHVPRWIAKIGYNQDLNIHHKSYEHLGNENEYVNLEVLCRRCHDIETHGKTELKEIQSFTCKLCQEKHWNRYNFLCNFCEKLAKIGGNLEKYWHISDANIRDYSVRDSLIYHLCRKHGITYMLNKISQYEEFSDVIPF